MYDAELFSPTFLDTEHKWGRLNALVIEEHEFDRPLPHPQQARKMFIDANCPSAVHMLDWVERHDERPVIRITGLRIVARLENDTPLAECTGELEIGLPSIGVSPQLWFLYLAARVRDLSIIDVVLFECICQALTMIYSDRDARSEHCTKH